MSGIFVHCQVPYSVDDNPRMTDSPNKPFQNPIVIALAPHLREAGLSLAAASTKAGLSPDFLSKLERRGAQASANARNLIALANALGIEPAMLLNVAGTPVPATGVSPRQPAAAHTPESSWPMDVPILGAAAGSAIGTFVLSNSPIGYVARPPSLQYIPEAYALYVQNDSMDPAYTSGSLVVVNPKRPPRAGDTVIIQTMGEDGAIQAWIKFLVRVGHDWVVARQLNPVAEIKYKRVEVLSIHKVPSLAELFGF